MEKIGLNATLGLSDWSSNVSHYLNDVQKMTGATNNAGKGISSSFSGLGGVSGILGGIGSALGGVATVAGGIITANLFGKMADGITSFVGNSISAIDQAQQLEMGLNALMTSNLLYEKSIQDVTVAQTKELMTEGEFAQKQAELTAKLNLQRASMQEQKERIRQLTEQWGANGLATIEAQARLEQMAVQIQATEQDLTGLTRTQTTYATSTETSYKQVRSLAEAQKLAAQQTKELQRFVEDLAVVSPFEEGQVALVSKLAAGAGLGVDAIKNFTTGFLDLSAAVGITSENLAFAGDQLLQVAKVGKLTTIDLRQLRRMGIDLEKIIGTQMSMSIDEFNAAAEKSPEIFNQLFDAVGKFSASNFPGAAKKMATSVSGLKSTFSDLVKVAGRRLFEPLVETLTPTISTLLDNFGGLISGGDLTNIGLQMADMVNRGLIVGRVLSGAFERGGISGVVTAIGNMLKSAWPDIQAMLGQGAINIAGLLGISPEVITQAQEFFGQITSIFQQVQAGEGGNLLQGWASQIIASIPGVLGNLVSSVSQWLVNDWPKIQETLNGWADQFWEWTKTAASNATQFLAGLSVAVLNWAYSPEGQTQIAAAGDALGKSLIVGLQQSGQNTEALGQVLLTLAQGLSVAAVAVAGTLIIVGGQLVANIVAGMAEKFGVQVRPWTFQQFREFAGWIGSIDWGAVGTGLMNEIGNGLAETAGTIAQTLTNSVNAWKKVINETKWADLGKSIITGILKGINDNVNLVYEKLKAMAWEALAQAGAAIGYGSPAAAFIPLGQSIPQGLVVGLNKGAGAFNAAFDQLFGFKNVSSWQNILGQTADDLEKIFDSKKIEASKVKLAMKQIKAVFRANAQEILGASDQLGKFQELLKKSGALGDWLGSDASQKVQAGLGEFFALWQANEKKAKAAQQGNLVTGLTKMFKVGASMNDLAKEAAKIIDSRVDTLAALLNTGNPMVEYEGQLISATEAQEKFNQAQLDQLRIQDDLAKMAANENKLSFLQKQLELLNTVKQAGLNAADIFGGIGLGLNASLPDLVEATGRVVEAMIQRANADLEIHSPSGVFERMGELSGAGLERGWQSMASSVLDSIRGTMSQIASPYSYQPAYANAGGGSGPTLVFNIGSISSKADGDYFAERVERVVSEKL